MFLFVQFRTLFLMTYKVNKHSTNMKTYMLVPLIAVLALVIPTALADNNSNIVTSTSTNVNGQGSTTTTTTDNGHTHTDTHHWTGSSSGSGSIIHFPPGFPFNGPPSSSTSTDHTHLHFFHVNPSSTHVIVVHRTIVNHEDHFSTPTNSNTNVPIVPITINGKVVFVAPINCKLTSSGDKIQCDFDEVQIN